MDGNGARVSVGLCFTRLLIRFCTLCWHFFEHFSEAKALSIIRAF